MPFGLYTILFYFTDLVWESIILVLLPLTCKAYAIAIQSHDYCAVFDPPPTPLVYAMHHAILAMAMSCKGQDAVSRHRFLVTWTHSFGEPEKVHS